MSKFPLYLYSYFLVEVLVVAVNDFRTKKIKNIWSIIHVIAAGLLFLFHDAFVFEFTFFKFPAILFGVGYILYLLKIIGAGDVKYLSTLLLLVPKKFHEEVIVQLLITTFFVGFLIVLLRVALKWKNLVLIIYTQSFFGDQASRKYKFSYAPVILITWLLWGWRNIGEFR